MSTSKKGRWKKAEKEKTTRDTLARANRVAVFWWLALLRFNYCTRLDLYGFVRVGRAPQNEKKRKREGLFRSDQRAFSDARDSSTRQRDFDIVVWNIWQLRRVAKRRRLVSLISELNLLVVWTWVWTWQLIDFLHKLTSLFDLYSSSRFHARRQRGNLRKSFLLPPNNVCKWGYWFLVSRSFKTSNSLAKFESAIEI